MAGRNGNKVGGKAEKHRGEELGGSGPQEEVESPGNRSRVGGGGSCKQPARGLSETGERSLWGTALLDLSIRAEPTEGLFVRFPRAEQRDKRQERDQNLTSTNETVY